MSVTIDVAGAASGGAARYRAELLRFLAARESPSVRVIGENRSLSPAWLVRREISVRDAAHAVAVNNVAFFRRGGNTVVIRNALHFPLPTDPPHPDRTLRHWGTTRLVHTMMLHADRVVVPTSGMARRVLAHVPAVEDRLDVRFHPLSPPPPLDARKPVVADAKTGADGRPFVLVPSLPASHKRLPSHLVVLQAAIDLLQIDISVAVTQSAPQSPVEHLHGGRILWIGPQSPLEVLRVMQSASIVYSPAELESFGYPLAESRSLGIPVVAVDTEQNREVAGPALAAFSSGDVDSLAAAIASALTMSPVPDPLPFNATRYFAWLLNLPEEASRRDREANPA